MAHSISDDAPRSADGSDTEPLASMEELPLPEDAPCSHPSVLATSAFDGSYDCRLRDARNGGQSRYDGALVVLMIARDLVAAVLPPDMSLATSRLAGNDCHPIILLLGRQYDLCWLQQGNVTRADVDPYNELMLIVPFTVHPPSNKWHNYVVRMYLDNEGAVVIGDIYYAYAKEHGSFSTQGQVVSVQDAAGSTVYRSTVLPSGNPISIAAGQPSLPGLAELKEVFAMPMVGYFGATPPPALPPTWRFSCSYFEWIYDEAYATPAQSELRFVSAFRPGMQAWVDLGPLHSAPCAAFRVTGLRWRLSYELPLWPPNMPPTCNFF